MQRALRLHREIADRVVFMQEFLKHPHQVASIIPSSRFLERRIIELAEVRSLHTVVELGAGTGGTTRAMLSALPPSATLLVIEINPQFCGLLRRIPDARLIVHCGSAEELRETLSLYRLPAPEAVVSGIPFSTMDRIAGARILEAISSALAPGGRFVAYQVSTRVADLSRPLLGPERVEVELLNVPPMRLYRWEKRTA
jgi:phosphatidylethanolamine/phosphatidyl-N-methylethanolamine N-methyltransferase